MLAFAALQSHLQYREARAARYTSMELLADDASDQAKAIIDGARALLEGLRAQGDIGAGGMLCEFALRSALAGQHVYANLALADASGAVTCSARALDRPISLDDRPWFLELRDGAEFVVSDLIYGSVSDQRVLVAGAPINAPDGAFRGALMASVAASELARAQPGDAPQGVRAVLVDASGALLDAPDEFGMDAVPMAWLEEAYAEGGANISTTDADGRRVDVAVRPLVGDDVFVVAAAPHLGVFSELGARAAASFVLSLMMWLLALIAVWLSTERLVLRWLAYLGRLARIYGSGRLEVTPVRAANAPAEIAEFADAMAAMALKLRDREGELRDSLDQKQMLLKEIHHRVKNNLQIIVSLLNIQISASKSQSARDTLDEARGRINALALVHKSLYEAEDLRLVRLAPFFEDLARQLSIAAGGVERDITLEADVDDIALTPERAVPLALFVTEAAMNAYKHAFAERAGGAIRIMIKADEDGAVARVAVEDDGVGIAANETVQTGTGSSLMNAFARQLGGEAQVVAREPGGVAVRLAFPLA